jgi:putative oxidoreductase
MKKASAIKHATIVEIISALFILLFLYTALSKTYNINYTVATLRSNEVFRNSAREISWGVVILEYLAALMLLIPKLRILGLYSSLIMMAGFTVYILFMMIFTPNLPCSCGGVIKQMTWTQHLIFNIFFTLLAITAIVIWRKKQKLTDNEVAPAPIAFN